MVVAAGPPGSGKSTAFPVAESLLDHFNIDDIAAELNRGSYRNIPYCAKIQLKKSHHSLSGPESRKTHVLLSISVG